MEKETEQSVPNLFRLWPDAGQVLGLTRSATYRAVRDGTLPTVTVSGRMKVAAATLAAIIGRPVTLHDLKRAAKKVAGKPYPASSPDKVPSVQS